MGRALVTRTDKSGVVHAKPPGVLPEVVRGAMRDALLDSEHGASIIERWQMIALGMIEGFSADHQLRAGELLAKYGSGQPSAAAKDSSNVRISGVLVLPSLQTGNDDE